MEEDYIVNIKKETVERITIIFETIDYGDAIEFCGKSGYIVKSVNPILDNRSRKYTGKSVMIAETAELITQYDK